MWHDDGTVRDEAAKEHAMYQRSTDNAALNYQESAQVATVETDQPAAASHQMHIPTPSSGPIPEEDQAALNAAAAAGTAGAAAAPGVTMEGTPASQEHTHIGNGTASGTAAETVASELKANEAVTSADSKHNEEEAATAVPPAASDIPTPLPCSSNEAAAAAEHITHAAEPVAEDHAVPAIDTAKESDAQQPPAEADHAHETAQDSENKPSVPGSDAPMPDGNSETALNSSTAAQQPDGEASTASLSAENALDQQSAWQGKAKGPGLGDSREFSGGPMTFERPKYRHSPYGLPSVRPGGRFAPELGRSSPRGRGSPTGRSFGRGFSEPPRQVMLCVALMRQACIRKQFVISNAAHKTLAGYLCTSPTMHHVVQIHRAGTAFSNNVVNSFPLPGIKLSFSRHSRNVPPRQCCFCANTSCLLYLDITRATASYVPCIALAAASTQVAQHVCTQVVGHRQSPQSVPCSEVPELQVKYNAASVQPATTCTYVSWSVPPSAVWWVFTSASSPALSAPSPLLRTTAALPGTTSARLSTIPGSTAISSTPAAVPPSTVRSASAV